MPSIPSTLPPSLWSDPARRVAAVVALLLVAGIGFGVGFLVFYDSGSDETAATRGRGRRGSGASGGGRRRRPRGAALPGGGDPEHHAGRRRRRDRRRRCDRARDLPL